MENNPLDSRRDIADSFNSNRSKPSRRLKPLQGWLVRDDHRPLYSISWRCEQQIRKRPEGPARLAYAQQVKLRWDRMQKFYRDRNRKIWARLTLVEKTEEIGSVDYRDNIYDGRQEQLVHECQLDMKNLYSRSEVQEIQAQEVAKYGNKVQLQDTGQSVPILWSHGCRGFYFETFKEAEKFGRQMLGPDVEFEYLKPA